MSKYRASGRNKVKAGCKRNPGMCFICGGMFAPIRPGYPNVGDKHKLRMNLRGVGEVSVHRVCKDQAIEDFGGTVTAGEA